MPASRIAGLFLFALAAPSLGARVRHQLKAEDFSEQEATLENFLKTGVWLTESCQDYPEAFGFSLGTTVRINLPGTRMHNHAGLVGCQDPEQHGKVCLEGLKGCYAHDQLKPISTLVFTFHTLGGAVGQIFAAIKDDVEDAWEAIKFSLSAFASSVSNRITEARAQIALKCAVCDADKGEVAKKQFDKAAVMTRSRLAILVDSAVERWGRVMEGIKSVAEATKAQLVKIANHLSEKLSEFYDAHLKDIVEALKRYLGGIAAAVVSVPDELNPLAGGKNESTKFASMVEVQEEPSGLSKDIEGFVDKVGELGARVMDLSEAAYEAVASGLGVLMSGAGRLIAAASSVFGNIKTLVQGMASAAVLKVQEWGRNALGFACNFDMKKTAQAAWASMQEGFSRAMDAVHGGYKFVKQSLQDAAASLAATVTAAVETIKSTSVAMYESAFVQGALERIKEEIRVLKDLIVESASLAAQFVGGFMSYFGRFVPRWVKEKFKTKAHKAKELAKKITGEVAELISKLTDGEAETIEIDDDAVKAE